MARARPYRYSELSHLSLAEAIEHLSVPEPNSGCWLWIGRPSANGYGRLTWRGRPMLAHRASWEAANIPIPDGALICHKCDNRGCVNPAHLYIGTQSDNMHDKWRRGRANVPLGELHHSAKLTADDIHAIRASTEPAKVLARRYGLWGASSISNIRKRRTWKHLAEKTP